MISLPTFGTDSIGGGEVVVPPSPSGFSLENLFGNVLTTATEIGKTVGVAWGSSLADKLVNQNTPTRQGDTSAPVTSSYLPDNTGKIVMLGGAALVGVLLIVLIARK